VVWASAASAGSAGSDQSKAEAKSLATPGPTQNHYIIMTQKLHTTSIQRTWQVVWASVASAGSASSNRSKAVARSHAAPGPTQNHNTIMTQKIHTTSIQRTWKVVWPALAVPTATS
jgi:hypothetical protein